MRVRLIRAVAQVELERLVDGAVDRQVPLAGVLDGLPAGADLELDQPDVGVVGVEGLGDAAQVVDVGAGVEGVAHHRPLDGVGAADLALLGGRRAVGVPGVRADADPDRGRDEVTLVAGQPDLDAVGVLGGEGVVHRLEVGQRARGEVVALGGVDVEVVERLEVGAVAERHLDAGLVGLLDVAPPELVHPGEDVGLRARLPVLVDQRDLEVELRLPRGEAALRRLLLPPQLVQLRDDAGAVLGAVERRYVAEPAHRRRRRCRP